MFDTVAIPVSFITESKPKSVEGILEWPGIIDGERGNFNIVTLAKFAEEL